MAITRNQRASRTNVSTDDDDGTNETHFRRPRFFKIIHNDIIQNGNLDIPPKFVGKYGADLSLHATLKVPDGLTWGVKLNKDSNGGDGAVRFQIGQLDQFLKYYSIGAGHLLLFKYHGNSHFRVIIFDVTASEINYPADSSDDEVHFHHYHEGGPSEIKRSTTEEEEEEEEEDYCAYASTDEDESPLSSSEEREVRASQKNKKKRIHLKTKDEDRAMRMIKLRATLIGDEFRSKNPSFAIGLQPAYIYHKYLPIPASFNGMHMFSHEGRKIRARVEGGRFWLLGFPKKKKSVRLTVGVASLLKDNDLVVGDVILVELMEEMKSNYLEAKVYIHRA